MVTYQNAVALALLALLEAVGACVVCGGLVGDGSPRYAWARYARARPFALPPGWKASTGMRVIVAKLQNDQRERHTHSLACKRLRHEGVFERVRRSVRGRQCDGDDEVGRDEAEQTEDEQLARPPGQQPLEHGDRTFAMRAGARHSGVHW